MQVHNNLFKLGAQSRNLNPARTRQALQLQSSSPGIYCNWAEILVASPWNQLQRLQGTARHFARCSRRLLYRYWLIRLLQRATSTLVGYVA